MPKTMVRSARKLIGWVSLAIFVGACAMPLLNVHDLDLNCGADDQVLLAGGTSTTIRSRQDASSDFHCVLCHWLRAVSGLQTTPTMSAAVVLLPASSAGTCAESSIGLLSRCDGPLRAPPAVSS